MRKVAVSLAIAMLVFLCVASGMLRGSANSPKTNPAAAQQPARAPAIDPPGTVNGATSPDMIPDRVAYSLVFRLISSQHGDEARQRIRSYVRQLGLGKKTCETSTLPGSDESDIEAFLAAADEYGQRVGILDRQVKEIKDRNWPNPSPQVMLQLEQLQKRKEAIADEIINSLSRRISKDGLMAVRTSIGDRVKHRVKIRPDPPSPSHQGDTHMN